LNLTEMSRQRTNPTRVNIFVRVQHFFTKVDRTNNGPLDNALSFDFL
jgi:hypothetical protein